MKVEFKASFIKHYKNRFRHLPSLQKKFANRLLLFTADPHNPILKDHELTDDLAGNREYSISGDIRVIYYIENDTAYFIDIGTHNQVYR